MLHVLDYFVVDRNFVVADVEAKAVYLGETGEPGVLFYSLQA